MKIKSTHLIILNMFVGIGGFVYLLTTGFLLTKTGFYVGMALGFWGFLFGLLYVVWAFRDKLKL